MLKVATTILPLLFVQTSFAALLTPSGPTEKVESVNIYKSVTATIEKESILLSSIGAGLRAKKVVFLNVKVYVGQLFAPSADEFKKSSNEPLSAIKNQRAVAIQLHFLRDVDAENVQKSFIDALKANKVNTDDSSVKQFLDTVQKGGEAKQGKSLTILGSLSPDGNEVIYYETTSGAISEIKGSKGFVEKIFSIWLGTPADDGVANLKKSILKAN